MARTKQTKERSKQGRVPGKAGKTSKSSTATKAPRAKSTAKYAKEALVARAAAEVAIASASASGSASGGDAPAAEEEKKKRKKSRKVTMRRRYRELIKTPATFPRAMIRKAIDSNLDDPATRVSKMAVLAIRDAAADIMLQNVSQVGVFAQAGKRKYILDRDIIANRSYKSIGTR